MSVSRFFNLFLFQKICSVWNAVTKEEVTTSFLLKRRFLTYMLLRRSFASHSGIQLILSVTETQPSLVCLRDSDARHKDEAPLKAFS